MLRTHMCRRAFFTGGGQGLFIGFLKTERTREVDLLDGLQKAHNTHRSSVSSISVMENSTPLQGFEEVKDRKLG